MTSNTINDALNQGLSSGEDTGGQASDLSPQAPRPTRVARPDAMKLPIEIARLLSDSRCTDVIILDVRGLIDVQDFIVIASGTSERQIRAVSHQVKDLVEANGQVVYRTSADSDARWIVIDCVDVVVHLLEPNERSFRDFESMWGDAPRLSWEREGEAARQSQARQSPVAVPLKSDAPQAVESTFAPTERVEPAVTARVARAKASTEVATAAIGAATEPAQPRRKPKATKKAAPAKRGVSKAKAKAKAAAKADGTATKRRAAAKQVKRAATKAAGKGAKKVTKRVAKKPGQRKDKPAVKAAKKKTAAKASAARTRAAKPAAKPAKRKSSSK